MHKIPPFFTTVFTFFLFILIHLSWTCTQKIHAQHLILDKNFKKSESFGLYFYIDSTKKALFEVVVTKKFESATTKKNFNFIKYPVWVKITFENKSQKNRFLLDAPNNIDDLEFWQKDHTNSWQKIHTGNRKPFHTRPIWHRDILFDLYAPYNTTQTIYIKCTSITRVRLYMTIWEKDTFDIHDQQETLFYGFFYGIIFLMLAYNFVIWVRLRDTAYLFYVCFAGAMFMVQFTSYGFAYQYFFPNIPFFNNNGIYIWVGLVNICAGNFCRYFLDLPTHSKFWNNILFYASFYGVSVIILSFILTFPNITLYMFICNPIYSLFLVSVGIIFWRKGNRFAPFFALAWFAYVVGLVLVVGRNWDFIPYNFFTGHSLQMSTIVEIVVLSLAMGYKHKVLDDESKENLLEIQKLRFEQTFQNQEKQYLEEMLTQQEKIHELENEKMQRDLDQKERELTTTSLQIYEKNSFIHQIQKKLEKISENHGEVGQDFKEINKNLNENLNLDADWDKFKIHFEQVHPLFFQKLTQKYNSLSNNDLKILSYLKINLNTKEIAKLLNIDPKSIKMAKYRLKKKLDISNNENNALEFFLRDF